MPTITISASEPQPNGVRAEVVDREIDAYERAKTGSANSTSIAASSMATAAASTDSLRNCTMT